MHGPLAYRSWRCIPALVAAALILSTALPARAGIIVSVESVSANQGTTGNTLEVDVQNTGAPVDIASFSFEISVAAGSGVNVEAPIGWAASATACPPCGTPPRVRLPERTVLFPKTIVFPDRASSWMRPKKKDCSSRPTTL